MKTANEPRAILDVLLGAPGDALPFPPANLEQAKLLAQNPDAADPVAVGELPEPLALAVLEAGVRAKSIKLADKLTASSNRALAKAAKKALYKLRSLGVEVPLKRQEAVARESGAPSTDEPLTSILSAITGTGERALIVARPVRGRVETVQIVIADEHGIVHLGTNEVSRGMYKKVVRDSHQPNAPSSIEISLDEARAIVAEAAGTNLRTKTAFPDGLDLALRHLGVSPREHPPALPQPEDGDQALAVNGAKLHDEKEIAQWLPPVEDLRGFALKAQEVAGSPLYIDENQRASQLKNALQTTSEAFLTPHVREVYGRRLWAMATFFERTGRPNQAAIARAEARRLFHAAPGVFSPFVTRLFEKVLELSGVGPQLKAGGALEKPEQKSPGGLILP